MSDTWVDDVVKSVGWIKQTMQGRIAISDEEIKLFLKTIYAQMCYVEIGCLWGGTAILAAVLGDVKKVITIDKSEVGYWDTGDTGIPGKPVVTLRAVLENFAKFGTADRINLVVAKSDPWPLRVDLRPDVVMIDGDHSYEGCLRDWKNVSKICDVVMLHDYQSGRHPGVDRVMDEVIREDARWKIREQAGTLVVVERVDTA